MMPQIDVIGHRLLELKIPDSLPRGLLMDKYDWFDRQKEVLGPEGYNLWISTNDFWFTEYKNKETDSDAIIAKLRIKFSIANIDFVSEEEIRRMCIILASDKLQEIFNVSMSERPLAITVMPPADSDIW